MAGVSFLFLFFTRCIGSPHIYSGGGGCTWPSPGSSQHRDNTCAMLGCQRHVPLTSWHLWPDAKEDWPLEPLKATQNKLVVGTGFCASMRKTASPEILSCSLWCLASQLGITASQTFGYACAMLVGQDFFRHHKKRGPNFIFFLLIPASLPLLKIQQLEQEKHPFARVLLAECIISFSCSAPSNLFLSHDCNKDSCSSSGQTGTQEHRGGVWSWFPCLLCIFQKSRHVWTILQQSLCVTSCYLSPVIKGTGRWLPQRKETSERRFIGTKE